MCVEINQIEGGPSLQKYESDLCPQCVPSYALIVIILCQFSKRLRNYLMSGQ